MVWIELSHAVCLLIAYKNRTEKDLEVMYLLHVHEINNALLTEEHCAKKHYPPGNHHASHF